MTPKSILRDAEPTKVVPASAVGSLTLGIVTIFIFNSPKWYNKIMWKLCGLDYKKL